MQRPRATGAWKPERDLPVPNVGDLLAWRIADRRKAGRVERSLLVALESMYALDELTSN